MREFWDSYFMGRHPRSHSHSHRSGSRRSGFWAEIFGDNPPRAERGDVRYLVLVAIADEPRHGYEIIQTIEDKTGGAYRPSPGVIYPTLQLLEEMGHAKAGERDGRKVYGITAEGRIDLDAHS